ncbi:hypothetical protein JDV09_06305 [Mycobacterium sp. Y57]|uniref:hypothetical protein n=1 Tax=Mycolicibacterium xanthum TaxID=2796469 RepID=UPI001C841602|nr:hypothetical protein [Mycolicibacterium xanthum]MBX7431721.1 hypothetical protein [Mycolicibacterium xanthum]
MNPPPVVLVIGPALAGVTSLIAALAVRVPEAVFVDTAPAATPVAVLFVVSAIAPITESDCALIDLAAADTDGVVGVLAKVDDHRDWHGVLAVDRERLAHHAARFRDITWVPTAAAPRAGLPLLDELVAEVRRLLQRPESSRRNLLRGWETRVHRAVSLIDRESGLRSYAGQLRRERAEVLRDDRRAAAVRTAGLRADVQRARVELSGVVRERCALARAELQDAAATATRGRVPAGATRARVDDFAALVRRRCDALVADVDAAAAARRRDLSAEYGVHCPPTAVAAPGITLRDPPLRARRLERRLSVVLGAGFGFGVALMSSRLLAGLAPGLAGAGLAAGGIAGLLLSLWVVGMRGLLQDRAVLDRWVAEVTVQARGTLDERVAAGMLTAEVALTAATLAAADAARESAARQVAALDAELGESARAAARDEALRSQILPTLEGVLAAVRRRLEGPESPRIEVTGQ